MSIRTVYSTNDGMTDLSKPASRNEFDCAIAIGSDDEGQYSIHTLGPVKDSYAILTRDELKKIRDAIDFELRTN